MQTAAVRAPASSSSATDLPSKTLVPQQRRHPGMLRLESHLRKMLLYSLLCLLAKALAANPCFGFAMQYCQLRMPNALVAFARAFARPRRSSSPSSS
ncbi:hypothetical protein PHYPSEUDO_004752 [Phytophthora pseudosyringae]|uniref:Uncharacterized protein n=1 Tax=Phytophthora pseudosyringae TaxID=221518 RepID=A0A8T1VR83_9STRA|nr:hypothetical protein PHYPSEUDO_004752 [Phytophthora pseudosyringae]